MKRVHSLLWFTAMATTSVLTLLSSCTVDDGSDDDDGGEGGEISEGGKSPTGGTSGGTTPAGGGGAGGTDEGGAGGTSAGAGGMDGGSGGAGGFPAGKVCQGAAGEGQGGAEGKTCADYCSDFFDTCSAYADEALFTSEADCRTSCDLFLDEQLCCRAFYVSLAGEAGAGGGASADCMKAAGETTCN